VEFFSQADQLPVHGHPQGVVQLSIILMLVSFAFVLRAA
jgi:hypothetical protein